MRSLAAAFFCLTVTAAGSAAAQTTAGALRAQIEGVYASAGGRVIVLQVPGNPLYLPIWVADREAEVALGYIHNITPPRPMTHDLLRNTITLLGGRVIGVYVSDLRGSTYIGRVDILEGGAVRQLDSRSSDAICLGLATRTPIYVMPHVLSRAGMTRDQLAQQGIFVGQQQPVIQGISPQRP